MLLIQIYQSAHRYFRASRCIDDIRNYLYTDNTYKHPQYQGCRHSSVDSSAPSILPPWVQLPSMPSMLFSIIVKFVLYLSMRCERRTKINKKEAGFGPFFKKHLQIPNRYTKSFIVKDPDYLSPTVHSPSLSQTLSLLSLSLSLSFTFSSVFCIFREAMTLSLYG